MAHLGSEGRALVQAALKMGLREYSDYNYNSFNLFFQRITRSI